MNNPAASILAKIDGELSQIYQGLGVVDPDAAPPAQDNPPTATPPVPPAAPPTNAPEPPQVQGQAPAPGQTPPATPPQVQGQAQPPANPSSDPSTPPPSTPSNEDLLRQIEELRTQVSQGQQNYNNLRAYADRVAGDNAKLRRGQTISSLTQAPPRSPGSEPAPAATPPQTPPTPSPLDAIEASIKKVEQVATEYPEVMAPVIETLRMQQQVIASLSGQVEPIREALVQDEEARQIEERKALEKRHTDTIKAVHQDYETIVQTPDFSSWVLGLDPEDNADAVRIIQHGNAYEIAGLLTRFKNRTPQTPPPPTPTQQDSQRAAAAALDNEGRVLSTPPISPDALNQPSGVVPLSLIQAAAKDVKLWAKHEKEIEYAQAHGLIDYSR